MSDETRSQALSFGTVAETYERARPSYPVEAAQWLTGPGRLSVLELGAGTGKLTGHLVDAGHDVVATDPLPQMLRHLKTRVPHARSVVASAEHIPMASRSVDVVVCAQSFHWFDHPVALAEIARVLRPGGVLGLVWNQRDQSIPWVRRLGRLIGEQDQREDLAAPLTETEHFGWVDEQQFRNWSKQTGETLSDLVRSRSQVAVMSETEREALLAKVAALYEDYGRGADGMLLPYVTRCYRAVVKHPEPVPAQRRGSMSAPPEDPDPLLIDFK